MSAPTTEQRLSSALQALEAIAGIPVDDGTNHAKALALCLAIAQVELEKTTLPSDHAAWEAVPATNCPTCGQVHPACKTDGCSNATRCPSNEPGEHFAFCDACDQQLANVEGGA